MSRSRAPTRWASAQPSAVATLRIGGDGVELADAAGREHDGGRADRVALAPPCGSAMTPTTRALVRPAAG